MDEWIPRTELGKMVANGTITLDEIFQQGKKIKEPQIVDKLLPNLQIEIIYIGGSPGKGGGIKRTPTRRTARMHRSGRRYKISAAVVVGNGNGYLGVGLAHALEHRIAIEKATDDAKLHIIPIKRGCGSWECGCGGNHTIPFLVLGRSGSVRVSLIPAPKGIGLCVNDEAKKIMRLAGIKDLWARCYGESRSRLNYLYAVFNAFKNANMMKVGETAIRKKVTKKEYEITEDEVEEEIEEDTKEIKEEIKALKKRGKKLKEEEKELEELADEKLD
jgi:small subunit ribosomal protein S5